jgi:allantoate deiminase
LVSMSQVVVSNPTDTIASESPQYPPPIDAAIVAAARKLVERCDALARISDEELPRITRTFLSPATKRAHEVVSGWMREAGLRVVVDAAGNLIGRREGGRRDGKTFVIGSHLDTVPNAGKYDGILGVLAGIALADLLKGTSLPFALEVVGFSEEEGVRFGRPYIGSHAYAGTLDAAWLGLVDKSGITVEEAIGKFGLDPGPLKSLRRRTDLLGYLEVHIEQGPVLEELGVPLAVVSAIAGQTRLTAQFTGVSGHAGTVPMSARRDALAGASEAVLVVESIGRRIQGLVATVGRIDAEPNASNVIAGDVRFTVDVRHSNDVLRREAVEQILAAMKGIAQRRRLELDISSASQFPAVHMATDLSAELGAAVRAATGQGHVVVGGAGHDAVILASIAPAAMLFLRNPGGVSHNPNESIIPGDLPVALHVMQQFVKKLSSSQESA